MTPTKLLIGQIFAVLAVMILGVWAATQWTAAMLAYPPQLGAPWLTLVGRPIYPPWRLFDWWFHYEAYAPAVFNKAGLLAGASGFLGCATAIIGSLWRARQSPLATTYGSSRWADHREIKKAGLFGDAGVFLGRLDHRYLRHDGPEHVMAFAPTRSGKGVGLVVPTLLSWQGSAVVHDIKGENWTLTAGWRAKFSHCLLLNPTDLRSARYNPLLEVRKGLNEVRDVQNIADVLVDPRIGDAWEARWGADGARIFYRVTLDDPLLAAPMTAALFPDEDGMTAQLVWSRARKPAEQGDAEDALPEDNGEAHRRTA